MTGQGPSVDFEGASDGIFAVADPALNANSDFISAKLVSPKFDRKIYVSGCFQFWYSVKGVSIRILNHSQGFAKLLNLTWSDRKMAGFKICAFRSTKTLRSRLSGSSVRSLTPKTVAGSLAKCSLTQRIPQTSTRY